jgi:HlyD family secretion protein
MIPSRSNVRRPMSATLGGGTWIGLTLVGGLLVGTAAWASYATLAGAVIGPGAVIVESYGKRIQHADGGIVAEIYVEDGTEVKEGDLLFRLDDTITRSQFAISEKALDQALARLARLEAERDDHQVVEYPREIQSRIHIEHVAKAIHGENAIFEALSHTYEGKIAQLQERKKQLIEETKGYEAQYAGRKSEITLLKKEMAGTQDLVKKDYAPVVKMLAEQRQLASLEGEFGRLAAQIAQTRGRVTETDLQVIQVEDEETKRVASEIRDTERRVEELKERKTAAEDKLKRIEMRAPRNGFVHELQIHTIGAVIRTGEVVLTVIPKEDKLVIEARVRPIDIDQISVGQKALVRFPNFNRRTTPELWGQVIRIGADVAKDNTQNANAPDPAKKEAFYPVRIVVSEEEIKRLDGLKLLPGMPAETFIQTEERTAMSYLLKPMTDQLTRAFREK